MDQRQTTQWNAMVEFTDSLLKSELDRSLKSTMSILDTGLIVEAAAAASTLSKDSVKAAEFFSKLPRKLLSAGRTDLALKLTRNILCSGVRFPDPEVVAALISSSEPEEERKELAILMRGQPPHWSMEHAFRHRFKLPQAETLKFKKETFICEGVDHREQLFSYFRGTNHPIEPAIRWMTPSRPVKLLEQENCILHIYNGGFIVFSSENKRPYSVFSSYVYNDYIDNLDLSQINCAYDNLFFCGDIFGPNNYFIWMANYLPRISISAKCLPHYDIAMENTPQKKFQTETLNYAGVASNRFHRLNPGNYAVKNFAALSTNTSDYVHCFHGGSLEYANHVIDIIPRLHFSSPERLFVTRAKNLNRTIANSDEIESYLKSHGFHTLDAGDHSVAEQATFFRQAKFIIGIHGAALANLMFCRPGTKILELLSPIGGSPSFGRISAMLQLDYQLLIGTTKVESGSLSTVNNQQNFSINLSDLQKAVELMLGDSVQT